MPPRRAAGETPASPPAGSGPAADGDGYLAFLRGAGLSPEMVGDVDREAAMADAGRLFATVVEGLMEVLATRSEVRNAFRLQQTVIRPRENNPLKFSATTTDALRALMTGRSRGYMPARQAVEEAVDDVKAHQIAVMAGVQGALKGLLHRFDPETLEQRFGAERGVLGLGSRKGRAWDEFVRLYDEIAAEAEDDFHAVLGREFAKAYESCGRSRRSGG
jgi:type VI secretion system protein